MSLALCLEMAEADEAKRQTRKARKRPDDESDDEEASSAGEDCVMVDASPTEHAVVTRDLLPIPEALGNYACKPSVTLEEIPTEATDTLPIPDPWHDLLLNGRKNWEIRGTPFHLKPGTTGVPPNL